MTAGTQIVPYEGKRAIDGRHLLGGAPPRGLGVLVVAQERERRKG